MRRYIITYSRPSSRGGREKELKMNTENAPKTENAQQSNADPVKRYVTAFDGMVRVHGLHIIPGT